ncbi:Stp1/IreP family PP2C-type Ser/Thr phosphatase [bacterium AH-315-K03]|nr:Stp1/IreP family PP2C-type Ser/Thr phosphatase [bacterium AH-315-K03]
MLNHHTCLSIINGRSDIGRVRDENEDHLLWYCDQQLPFSFAVIADGMGGYSGGSIASSMATTTVYSRLVEQLNSAFHACTPQQQILKLKSELIEAIHDANKNILEMKERVPHYSQMGTTLVIAIVWQNQVIIGHIGDSRAYRWNKQGLSQLTKDHSVVQGMIDSGSLTEDEARNCTVRNQLTRALGVSNDLEPAISTFELEQDCTLMLCSDGLTEYLDNTQIELILATHKPSLECCYRFIDDANQLGGKDNISVAIVECVVTGVKEKPFGHFSNNDDSTVRK